MPMHTHYLPLNKGEILHIVSVPREANCPKAISRNNTGKPTRIRAMKYGKRKAPEIIKIIKYKNTDPEQQSSEYHRKLIYISII